jgi:hypothetical protein
MFRPHVAHPREDGGVIVPVVARLENAPVDASQLSPVGGTDSPTE